MTTTTATDVQPAPKVKDPLVLPTRSDKHVKVLLNAIGADREGVEFGSTIGEREVVVVGHSAAEGVLRAISDATPSASIYDGRLLVASYVELRRIAPELPEVRSGRIARVVTGLNAARVDWATEIKLDGTLAWYVGSRADGPVKLADLVARYAADTPKPAKAAKAPKAEAPAPVAPEAPAPEQPKAAKAPRAKATSSAAKAPAPKVKQPSKAKVDAARALAHKKAGRPAEVAPIPKAAKAPRARKAS